VTINDFSDAENKIKIKLLRSITGNVSYIRNHGCTMEFAKQLSVLPLSYLKLGFKTSYPKEYEVPDKFRKQIESMFSPSYKTI